MEIPARNELLGMFKRYGVPGNIVLHCKTVEKVSVYIAKALQKKGVKLDIKLVEALSLVHDMFKAATLGELKEDKFYKSSKPTKKELQMQMWFKMKYPGLHEGKIAYEMFKDNYSDFARSITRESTWEKEIYEEKLIEEKIVSYVDTRVFLDKILMMKERTDDLEKRYSHLRKNKEWNEEKKYRQQLEKEIFSKLDFSPLTLKKRIN